MIIDFFLANILLFVSLIVAFGFAYVALALIKKVAGVQKFNSSSEFVRGVLGFGLIILGLQLCEISFFFLYTTFPDSDLVQYLKYLNDSHRRYQSHS